MKQELVRLIPMIRRFAYSLTGNQADADDLLQNTVERILAKGIPENIMLEKWMFRVCRNLWIDEYRSRKVRQNAALSPELAEHQIVECVENKEIEVNLQELNQAMNILPDEQRSIIALVALQGMSYKEVAETLAIPIGTVMSRLARARASLHKFIHFETKPQEWI
ncbi:sigma-70 family RNA polymerase sigma factor [Catenovulum sp. 2E275]|uniref:RNA polymerase sigma factor n=1 Tax=Catenovulum sp. 2E275 TaxID=2980497 RepID=UPI0021CE7361|nr:sigma-70 family RNA polymerase sigma factor [Catenovulum sp. 2E275]MCU4677078.1 sigma-70 family RNA polymerase sigma factor [Catenovulum sp. 2E275]